MAKKENIVEFVSLFPKIVHVFPEPEPASKNIPTWFKKVQSFYNNDQTPVMGSQQLTVKRCVAFLDMLTSGYILKSPVDIYVDTTEGKKIFEVPGAFSNINGSPTIGEHDMRQLGDYPIDEDVYVKNIFRINLIWVVKTTPGISCLFIQPQHYEDSKIQAVSAIIDTDHYPSVGLFSFLIKKDFKGIIPKGTPLVQVIPFKREEFSHRIIRDVKEVEKVKAVSNMVRTFFNSGYKKLFWQKKNYL